MRPPRAVKKSFSEMEALAKRKEEQRKLRDARRKQQEARVKEKLAKGGRNKQATRKKSVSSGDEADEDAQPIETAPEPEKIEDDDIEWYRQEVGEEPDAEETAELRAATSAQPNKRAKFNPLYRKRKKPDGKVADKKHNSKKPKHRD